MDEKETQTMVLLHQATIVALSKVLIKNDKERKHFVAAYNAELRHLQAKFAGEGSDIDVKPFFL